jgi:hypothetical protein
MLDEGELQGPRGGLRISYGNWTATTCGETHGSNSCARATWVRGATTAHMEALMEEAITGGRAAVAAIHRRLRF